MMGADEAIRSADVDVPSTVSGVFLTLAGTRVVVVSMLDDHFFRSSFLAAGLLFSR